MSWEWGMGNGKWILSPPLPCPPHLPLPSPIGAVRGEFARVMIESC